MFFKEHINTKNIIFLILLLITIKFASGIIDIFILFFACYVLACSLNPLVAFVQKKIPNRGVATTLVIALTIFVMFAFFFPVLVVTIREITAFFTTFPEKLAMIDKFIDGLSFYGYKFSDIFDLNSMWGSGAEISQEIINRSVNITLGLFQGIILFVAIMTIMFYFIKDKDYMNDKLIEFFPEKMKAKAKTILTKSETKVGGYVIAQIISNIGIWVLVSLYLWILGVDYAFLLGLIAGLLDIIPVLGPTVALILILVSAYPHGWITIAAAFVLFLGVQQLSNNLIRPIVFGKFLDMHPLLVIFALFVCGKYLGVIGVIFAPALAAIISVLIDELYLKPINKLK